MLRTFLSSFTLIMAEGGKPAPDGPPSSGSSFERILQSMPNVSGNDKTETSVVQHIPIGPHFGATVGSAGETHTAVEQEDRAVTEHNRYMLKSKLNLQGGKHADAIADFKKALEYLIQARGIDDRRVLDAHLRLGELCLQFRYRQDALNTLLRILQGSKSPAAELLWKCHDLLAQTYASLDDQQKEIEHYELAISLFSVSTSSGPERLAYMHNNAGYACKKLGKLYEAKRHFEKAKEIMKSLQLHESKNMVQIHLSLGDVYKSLGEIQLAIFELEKCIEVSTQAYSTDEKHRKSARLKLVELYGSIGNTAKAKEHKEMLQAAVAESAEGAAGTTGEPQVLDETMGIGELSLAYNIPQDLPDDVSFSYMTGSSSQSASLHDLVSGSSGGSYSLQKGAVTANNQGAVEGAPPLERGPPSEDSTPPKDDTTPGNLSLSEKRSTGMEVPQGHVPVAPIAREQHQLPIQILNDGSALVTTGFGHTADQDITVEPPAPITREFDDVAHEDIGPIDEGGSFHQIREVIIDPPSGNQSLSSDLASNSLDSQPRTRGMTEQAVENQGPLSVNGIQQHGMPAQVNWTTARQEGQYGAPVPEELPAISPLSGPAGANASAPVQPEPVLPRNEQSLDVQNDLVSNEQAQLPPVAQFDAIAAHLGILADRFGDNPRLAELLRQFSETVTHEIPPGDSIDEVLPANPGDETLPGDRGPDS